jgi:hypothetical protein
MTKLAELMVLPVVSLNKKAKFAAETGWMFHRMDAFERSRENVGLSIERVALVETPLGDFSISYLEGTESYGNVAASIRESPDVFDLDMMTRGKVLHGLDEDGQRHKRVALKVELDFANVGAVRQPWFSFAAQIAPGPTDQWSAFVKALNGERLDEFKEFNAKNGFVVFRGAVYHATAGDLGMYYIEGSEDPDSLGKALASDGPFETWLTERFQEVHGHDFRQGVPSPLVGKPWDWVKGGPNEIVAPLYNQVVNFLK